MVTLVVTLGHLEAFHTSTTRLFRRLTFGSPLNFSRRLKLTSRALHGEGVSVCDFARLSERVRERETLTPSIIRGPKSSCTSYGISASVCVCIQCNAVYTYTHVRSTSYSYTLLGCVHVHVHMYIVHMYLLRTYLQVRHRAHIAF